MKRKLTDSIIKTTKPKQDGKPTNLSDGGGLYLHVTTNNKVWRYNYRRVEDGKTQTLTIGKYPAISLKEAREQHESAWQLRERGIDPCQNKQILRITTTETERCSFEVIAQEWFVRNKESWSESHTERTEGCLKRDILPWLGKTNINQITPSDIIKVVQRVEERGAGETARRVKQCINQVYRYAVTLELAERNPAADVDTNIILKPLTQRSFAAITDPRQLGQLMRDIDQYSGTFIVRCALQLSALTMLRPGELRHAEWTEIDFETATWTIEIRRMKARAHIKRANQTVHIVPLSQQAVHILQELHPLTGRFQYIFPSARGASRCMSENTVRLALRTMGYDKETMTAHGFRSTASSLLNELGWNPDAIERQLAHKDTNPIRGIYNRGKYMDERRQMLQAWADHLDALRQLPKK